MKKRLVLLLSVTMAFSMFSSVALGAPATNGKVKSVSKGKAAAPRANVNRNKVASKASTPAKADTLSPEKVKEIETLYMPYFNKLKDLGLVNGRGDGQAELASLLSRREAAKLVADLYAKNDQAFATKLTEKKSSSNKVAYNDPNYSQCGEAAEIEALTDKGIVRGKDTTKKIFGINDDVTVQEAAHMLANVWASIDGNKLPENASNSASEYAKSSYQLALNSDWVSKDANPQAKALRGQFMQMAAKAWDMLGPQVKSYKVVDPKTVEFTMSDGGTHTEKLEKALEANKETEIPFTYKNKEGKEFKRTHKVKYEVTAAQSIKSVTADNLKLIRIEFDGKVDSKTAENVNNYKIADYDFESATLSADGNAVDLLIKENSKKLPKQKEVTLEFRGVKSSDNTRTFNQKMKFTPVDSKLPEVKEIKGLGTKAVKVVFSEPVTKETAGNVSKYKIDGKVIAGSSVKFTYPNVAVIKTDLAVGEYTMTVEGIEDFAEFKSLKEEKKFTVALDTEAPKILSAKAKDLRKVEIEFDESVESVAKAYHTSSSRAAKVEIKDTKVILTFDEGNALTSALSETTIYFEGVKDYSGNSANRETKLTPELDSTRPSIVGIESRVKDGRTRFIIEFSKALLRTDVTNARNYVLRDKDGKIFERNSNGFDKDGHPKRQPDFLRENGKEFDNKIVVEADDKLPVGDYTLEVSGLRDLSSPPNTMLTESKSVKVTNIDKFDVKSVRRTEAGDYWKIRIFFNQDIANSGDYSASSTSKYGYVNADGTNRAFIYDTEPSIYDGKTVEFKVAKKDAKDLGTSTHLYVSRVANSKGEATDGNYISWEKYSWNTSETLGDGKFKATSRKTAVIEYDGILEKENIYTNDFVFKKNGNRVYPSDYKVEHLSNDRTRITFEFRDEIFNSNATNVRVTTVSKDDLSTKDNQGYKIAVIREPGETFQDHIKPEVVSGDAVWSKTGAGEDTLYSVYVPFDEAISLSNHNMDVTVTVDGNTVENKNRQVSVVAASGLNKVLKIDFKSKDNEKFRDRAQVAVSVKEDRDGRKSIQDTAGNTTEADFKVYPSYEADPKYSAPAKQEVKPAELDAAVTAANEAVTAANEAVKAADTAVAAAKAASVDTAAADAAKTAADAAKTAADKAKRDALQAKEDESVRAANRAKTDAEKAKVDADAAKVAADKAKKAVDKAGTPVAADAAVTAAETAITAAKTAITEADKVMKARGVKAKVTMARLKLEEAEAQVADAKSNLATAKTASGTELKKAAYQDAVVAATKALEAATAAAEAATAETDAGVPAKVTDVKTTLATVKEKVEALKIAAIAVKDANQ